MAIEVFPVPGLPARITLAPFLIKSRVFNMPSFACASFGSSSTFRSPRYFLKGKPAILILFNFPFSIL